MPPIGEITTVEFAGIKHHRRRANERIVPENLTADDGWSHRGTFAGDAAAFMAAKRAGVGVIDPAKTSPATRAKPLLLCRKGPAGRRPSPKTENSPQLSARDACVAP